MLSNNKSTNSIHFFTLLVKRLFLSQFFTLSFQVLLFQWNLFYLFFNFRLDLKEISSAQKVESSVLYWLTQGLMIREDYIHMNWRGISVLYDKLYFYHGRWSDYYSVYKAFPWSPLWPVTDQTWDQQINLSIRNLRTGKR